ncbi:MAG: cell division/cell wall cluster transcriptional repressor MraZ [Chloroflexi bacterium]|nr:MAG: cell division/cell wall cluster transcriptional repressor MraZ [Chloroflexota bacterium]
MFLGRYTHSVDEKGRLAVPARFRDELAAGLVVTRGFDGCLLVYPAASWLPLAEKVSALSIGDPDARLLRRMLFANAVDVQLDKQGRVLVPAELRAQAGIEREAIVVGMHTFIEVWSPEGWAAQDAAVERDGAAIAERLATLV